MKNITRRNFLAVVPALTYPAMMALDMLRAAPMRPMNTEPGAKGKHILILGGGLCGLTSAYELHKLGYQCTILEASHRAGGRCFSIRNGTVHEEVTNGKQVASFDPGYYYNAGPSRIPHHHEVTMHYCRELGVPLEVYNNINENAYFFSEGKGPLSNKKIRIREIHNDVRGYMNEWLAKAVHEEKLDTGLSKEDTQKIITYLRAEGGLDIDRLYKVSARRGYKVPPGAGNKTGALDDPHTLQNLLASGLMDPEFYNVAEYTYELQMTLFQAVGGMDKIVEALEKKVGNMLRKNAEVTEITNLEKGVKVRYKEASGEKEISADYCICTIPLPVLSGISNNFSGNLSRAIDFSSYIQTGKMGLQFKRRFWEEDENIFGGITHTNNELTQLFYPNNDYLGKKGILIGYYHFNERALKAGELSYREREKLALEKGRLIHPQYGTEFEKSFSVCWHKTKFQLGGWAVYNEQQRNTLYKHLTEPDGNVYLAGEHTTYLNAWMAGAFESARSTVSAIHARVNETNTNNT